MAKRRSINHFESNMSMGDDVEMGTTDVKLIKVHPINDALCVLATNVSGSPCRHLDGLALWATRGFHHVCQMAPHRTGLSMLLPIRRNKLLAYL